MELIQNVWTRFGFRGIARALKQQRQNVSKYFNALLAKRFIYPHHRDGRQIYYCVSEDVRIIRDVPPKTQKTLFD